MFSNACPSGFPGAGDELVVEEGEEPPAEDPDKPALPAFPKYEGLGFESADVLPTSTADICFPPAVGAY